MRAEMPEYQASEYQASEYQAYVDTGKLRKQDKVSLDDFLSNRDRSEITEGAQPFFSGREHEISTFRQSAKALSNGKKSNATIIVEGPPGAGKSALLFQFIHEMENFPETVEGNRRWLPVILNGSLALSPVEMTNAIDEQIAQKLAKDTLVAKEPNSQQEFADRLKSFLGMDTSLKEIKHIAREIEARGVSGLGISIGPERDRMPTSIEAACRSRAKHWCNWQIVVLVDEAQGISAARPGSHEGTLSSIHQGFAGVPISFCAFGLPGTTEALGAVDVSRGLTGYDIPIACLDEKASEQAVDRCFQRFGVRDEEAWKKAVLERSSNWPQHLTMYLNAALTALKPLRESENTIGSVRGASLTQAIRAGDAGRKRYYGRRLSRLTEKEDMFEDYAVAMVKWLQGTNAPVKGSTIINRLMSTKGISQSKASLFLREARHAGLLTKDIDTGIYSIPIPSFKGHLLEESLPEIKEPVHIPRG